MDAIELPVLRLGLAGFSAEQESAVLAAAGTSRLTRWETGPMAGADAWIINGQCAQHLGSGRLRVASRQPGRRSLQLQVEGNRPIAFASPLPSSVEAGCVLDVANRASILEAIAIFEFALAAQAAQYLLAAVIVEQQDSLGSGAFEVRGNRQLIATVDMRGDARVLPSVRPANFAAATWKRVDRHRLEAPANFVRASLSELMWRYMSRTSRTDLLPDRYRTKPIFFRRAPRVDALLVEQEHLLVMRELAIKPATLGELRERVDLDEATLVRVLAPLYYVGSITCTRSRATPTTQDDDPSGVRMPPRHSLLTTGEFEARDLRQLTAPAPLVIDE